MSGAKAQQKAGPPRSAGLFRATLLLSYWRLVRLSVAISQATSP